MSYSLSIMPGLLDRRTFDATTEGGADASRVAALEARLAKLDGELASERQQRTQSQAQSRQQTVLAQAAQIERDALAVVETAKQKLVAAHEAGDASAIADATAAVGTATAEHTAARVRAAGLKHQAANPPKQEAPKVDTTNLNKWRDQHKDWYGVDPDMTREAMAISRAIESEGVLPTGSEQYFNAVTARLKTKYPDKFTPAAGSPGAQQQRGGAPVKDAQPSGAGRIPASVAEGYRRMGINVDDPEVAKQMIAAREIAVQKGFLPETPNAERIITR